MTDRAPAQGRVLVIIPTYNEIENIDIVTAGIRAAVPEVDILIADDNSPDGTGRRADELAAADPRIHVLHRPGKQGLSAAYLGGFRWGLERDYEVFVEFDADGSHQPRHLPALLAALEGADMVKGSRWVKGGSVVNWAKSRELLSRAGSAYTRLLLGIPVKDITGGLNLLRRSTLEAIIDDVDAGGFGIQRDLTWLAHSRGYRIVEVPIEFVERERGQSKLGREVVIEALRQTTRMGVRHRGRQLRAAASGAGQLARALGRTGARRVASAGRQGRDAA